MVFSLILKSFFQLGKHILFGRKLDVLLYYPQHFNRSIMGTNPYFEPIVEVCKENGLRYLMLEEPDDGTPNPRDPQCMKADFFFWTVTIMRKLMHVIYKGKELSYIDARVAHILDAVTFHKFRAKRYVTISTSMIDILAELSPMGVVYDYQHGILYNGHSGYFKEKDHMLFDYEKLNRRVMIWGKFYKKAFSGALSPERLEIQIKCVGYPLSMPSIPVMDIRKKESIVFSLQFTHDGDEKWCQGVVEMLDEALIQLVDLGHIVLLKHHPRFNNCINLDRIIRKYPFVHFTSESLQELVPQALLHVTWCSTTCFEFANYGVPTYFLSDARWDAGHTIFYQQYAYPLYERMTLSKVMARLVNEHNYAKDCKVVKEWYDSAYAPFDKQQMLQILMGNED